MAEDGITRRAAARDPVRVTDLLLTGQPAADSSVTDTGQQMFVTELLRREGRVDEPSPPTRPSRIFWLVAVLACLALVLGAVTASMAALSGPRTERTAPTSPVPASIVGAEALRPDLINASVEFPARPAPATSDQAAASPAATPTPTETPPDSGPAQQQPSTGRAAPGPAGPSAPDTGRQPPPPPDARPVGSERTAVLGTVDAFYRNVAVTPQQAFNLLDPQMRGSGYQDFRHGWAGVERVTVEKMRLDGPNAVLVTARLTRSDGTVLRTLQRVLVTPGAEPRITDARLFSASRS